MLKEVKEKSKKLVRREEKNIYVQSNCNYLVWKNKCEKNTGKGAIKDHTRKTRLKWKMCKVKIDFRKKQWGSHPEH